MTFTTYQIVSIAFSVISLLVVLIAIPLALGRWQQWKKDLDKWKNKVDKKVDIIDDIDGCIDQINKLNDKLYMKDGSPSYITNRMCEKNMEVINGHFKNYKQSINEKLDNFKGSFQHDHDVKKDFEAMYSIVGKILEKLEDSKN